jgi:hypothetical protein
MTNGPRDASSVGYRPVQDDTAGREAYHPPVRGVVRTIVGAIRVVHPAPTAAVVTLSAALAAILAAQNASDGLGPRTWLVTLSVLGSQVLTGATNDWADRRRDAVVQHDKPIPSGEIPARGAIVVAVAGLALQVAASVPLGPLALGLGLVASASAAAYNLGLSATPASVIPYLVSFGVLPFWIASGVDVPQDLVDLALLVLPAGFEARGQEITGRGDERLASWQRGEAAVTDERVLEMDRRVSRGHQRHRIRLVDLR